MGDYRKTKMYIIHSPTLIYVGHTILELDERLALHESDLKRWMGGSLRWTSSAHILMEGDYRIDLLEEYPCENVIQAKQREDFWMAQFDCVNYMKAYRSKEEAAIYKQQWANDNKERVQNTKQKWYNDHKDISKQRANDRYLRVKADPIALAHRRELCRLAQQRYRTKKKR
jgi:hypothetical protein